MAHPGKGFGLRSLFLFFLAASFGRVPNYEGRGVGK